MAEILCYIYIFHPTSLTLSHYLVKYKSTKLYSFSGKLLNNSFRTLFYFHQFNNFWQIHDKIAETLCLVLEVCPAPRTQALDDAPLASIAASRIDWLVKASQLIDQTHFKFVDVSYSGLVNFPLHKAYTPDRYYGRLGSDPVNSATTGLEKRSQVPFAPGERRCRCASAPSG